MRSAVIQTMASTDCKLFFHFGCTTQLSRSAAHVHGTSIRYSACFEEQKKGGEIGRWCAGNSSSHTNLGSDTEFLQRFASKTSAGSSGMQRDSWLKSSTCGGEYNQSVFINVG